MRHLVRGASFGMAVLVVSGCGAGFAPVRGKVVYPDGTPVTDMPNAQVVFEGVGADGKGYSAAGTLDADGHFVLTTEKTGDGAVAGKNKVLIAPYIPNPEQPPPKVMDPRFESFATSGLEAEVTASGPNDFTFVVERVKPPVAKKDAKKDPKK
ncbi:MAG: hypothetical protein C0467_29025 [Planctomycetaceae bacterium]|nr:hypothetical protein [Planctomycetaceae bacterium]